MSETSGQDQFRPLQYTEVGGSVLLHSVKLIPSFIMGRKERKQKRITVPGEGVRLCLEDDDVTAVML